MFGRLVRAGIGGLLLVIAAPLLFVGAGLWFVWDRAAPDGTYGARLEALHTDGHAIVVDDVDALLRADAPFARGGQTTLRLTTREPLVVALAPAEDVERYLDAVDRSRITRVRLARGPLPVDVTEDRAPRLPAGPYGAPAGDRPLPPIGESFWLAFSRDGDLSWTPSSHRGDRLTLVIMHPDATAGIDAHVTARITPAWLAPTTGGLLILGAAVFLLGVLLLAWPHTGRRVTRAVEALVAVRPVAQAALPAAPLEKPSVPTPPPVDLRFTWPPVESPEATRDGDDADRLMDAHRP